MGIVPEAWRKTVGLIAFGAALASAWFTLDARVADAESAARQQPDIKRDVADLKGQMGILRQQGNDIQSNVAILVGALVSPNAVSRGHSDADKPTVHP